MLLDTKGQTDLPGRSTDAPLGQPGPAQGQWYALYTRSHCEQLVYDQLAAQSFHLFLPQIDVWSRRGGCRHLLRVPMLPGYLFLRHAMDKANSIEVRQARGLVRILGARWDCLAVVSEAEIVTLATVMHSHPPARHYPYLRAGQRVRITHGPLAGVEGTLYTAKRTEAWWYSPLSCYSAAWR